MLQFVNTLKKSNKKYSISKESYKFANQLKLTLKETNTKEKTREAAKNMMKEAKTQRLNHLKHLIKKKALYEWYIQRPL